MTPYSQPSGPQVNPLARLCRGELREKGKKESQASRPLADNPGMVCGTKAGAATRARPRQMLAGILVHCPGPCQPRPAACGVVPCHRLMSSRHAATAEKPTSVIARRASRTPGLGLWSDERVTRTLDRSGRRPLQVGPTVSPRARIDSRRLARNAERKALFGGNEMP